MLLIILDALLRIRLHLSANNICCCYFKPSDTMIQDFNTKVVYNYDYQQDPDRTKGEENIIKTLRSLENNSCSGISL